MKFEDLKQAVLADLENVGLQEEDLNSAKAAVENSKNFGELAEVLCDELGLESLDWFETGEFGEFDGRTVETWLLSVICSMIK